MIICYTAARGLYTPTTWEEWSDPSYMEAAREMAHEVDAYEREVEEPEIEEPEIAEDGKRKLKYCELKLNTANQM